MTVKPVLIATRALPVAVEARANRTYQFHAAPETEPVPVSILAARTRETGARGVIITPTDRVDATVVAALPDTVAVIATFSVGYEHVDVAAAEARGILVTNTPGVLTEATADIALLLLLGAARRASEGERMMRAGAWTGWTPTQLMGTHLNGKRLGILGMGRIGLALAHRARALGMEIHYHNRSELDRSEAGDARYHARPEDLLAVADALSLHFPATPQTLKFLNTERLSLLPRGAIVVNTARGAVVDDEALIAALKSGQVAAAGLDVYDGEPKANPAYASLPNTFLLPHLGSATVETREAMGFKALDNLDAYFEGRTPPNRILPNT
ncbi:MAG: D-glycerate dehydrogenase [Rhodospirillum sp.]|nr:D-glycerate dehydrogenase [Rhodospirillum sp.]MCF8488440.1 D-glycerate dehydrogenase [Rhodospirillum sp.]MCF8499102.1 D-glycerate dehydrogenase [Rhodospirillum sp.]